MRYLNANSIFNARTLVQNLFKVVLFFVFCGSYALASPKTALQDYVNTPDPAFDFRLITTLKQTDASIYILLLTSQSWRTNEDLNQPLWQHQLSVVVPNTIFSRTGMMFINGGDNDDLATPSSLLPTVVSLAVGSGSVVSLLSQIPNQPLVFTDEPQTAKIEDDLIAYSFDKAMGSGDYSWPAYLPMVKSVVRAMDAVQAFIPDVSQNTIELDNFVVTGFSKRGATAWLTAAVDPRVIAIAPGVFDVLNFVPSFESHRKSYGEFSSALQAYQNYNVLDRIRIPEGQELLQIVDPYTYRDKLTMPKYIIGAAGDEFFPSDSAQFYADTLEGDNLLRYVANTNHSGDNGGVKSTIEGLLAWYQRIIAGGTPPKISWRQRGKKITVTTNQTPLKATLWQAHNPEARDFRFDEIGPAWQASPLPSHKAGRYQVTLEQPANGWKAYFVELSFAGVASLPEIYTTPVFISPEARPFSLAQAVNQPKSARFWQREFRAALPESAGYRPTYRRKELQALLPVRVFNQYLTTLEQAHMALRKNTNTSAEAAALRQCLATRLNIQSEELHWYSPLLQHNHSKAFLWRYWNLADKLYQRNKASRAAKICREINRQ